MQRSVLRKFPLASASIRSVINVTAASFHSTKLHFSRDPRQQYSADHYKDVKQDKPSAPTAPYITVYKKDNRGLCVALTTGIAFPGFFWTYQLFASLGMTPTPVAGIAMSSMGIGATILSLYYMREFYLLTNVTKLAVAGPEDPIILTRSGFFGRSIERAVPRSTLRGIPMSLSTERISQLKSFPFRVAGFKKFFLLDKKGLFDSSGVLDSILGYNTSTLLRCKPSPLNVDDEIAQNKADADYLKKIQSSLEKK